MPSARMGPSYLDTDTVSALVWRFLFLKEALVTLCFHIPEMLRAVPCGKVAPSEYLSCWGLGA